MSNPLQEQRSRNLYISGIISKEEYTRRTGQPPPDLASTSTMPPSNIYNPTGSFTASGIPLEQLQIHGNVSKFRGGSSSSQNQTSPVVGPYSNVLACLGDVSKIIENVAQLAGESDTEENMLRELYSLTKLRCFPT